MKAKDSAYILLSSLLFVAGASYSANDTNYFRQKRQSESSRCTLPPHPEQGHWKLLNGKANPGEKVLIASVITFECKSGYKLSSKIPLVCLGEWSSQAPQCEELCSPLYPSDAYDLKCTDKIGREVNCSEATHGTKLEYSCKTYYETPSNYKKTLFCENGKWDNPRPVCLPVCGKKISKDTEALIYGAKPNEKIEYPWVAAIYQKFNNSYEHICGGSILSQTVILTAAHCVTNDYGNVLPKQNYKVGVGKLYRRYQATEDTRAQYLELTKIIVPEDYKGDARRYAGDIAVLVVKKEITLNEVTQPVCFTNLKNIRLHAGSKGEVSGWGLAEGEIPSEVLRTLTIPYKYETVCAEELPPDWADRYNLQDKICAGFVNKSTSVCSGDSGGGLAFKYREDNRYYVHGIVSVAHKGGYICNIQQNALYTSVGHYYEFVERLLTKYAPKIKDCVLPPFPQNGRWTTERGKWKPGDVVPSETILKVECDDGFKESSTINVECSAAHNLPTCETLCPLPKFPRGTDYQCKNKEGQAIVCSTAIDGSTLWYNCPRKYQMADDLVNRTCVRGSWGQPKPECIFECGKNVVDDSGVGSQYPWNVGVYELNHNADEKKQEERYKYVCGGSLVSEYVVVTAAQCVTDESYHLLSNDDYLIGAGKLYRSFNDPRDTHAQFANVTYINIHPEYKLSRGTGYNIALVIVSTRFNFNNFIQPVCVVEGDDYYYYDSPFDKAETMIGWRLTEGHSLETVESLEVDQPTERGPCKVPSHISPYSFPVQNRCSKFKNESICLLPEDRGKGVIIKHKDNGRYHLLGVVLYFEYTTCQKVFWNTDVTGVTSLIQFIASYLNFVFQLFKIIVPEDYKGDIRKYAADIAVLVVKKEMSINEKVQRVCFTNMKNIHLHAGNKGEVLFFYLANVRTHPRHWWGLAEGEMPSEVLRSLVIPYKYETVCADELPSEWADRYNLKDKICAGFVNKSTSVCSGDSGGGLAFKYREDNRYYIHGIVSVSHQVGYMCNIQQNALYTSVASYYEFVDRLLTKYAPKVRDCILPAFPQNGKWTTEQGKWKPGDAVPSSTVLTVECDKGFVLSSKRSVDCSTAHNLPTCEMLCPKPTFPIETYYKCINREGQDIACFSATEGSHMWYSCPSKYKQAEGSFNRTCSKGSWGLPKPECTRECGKKVVDASGIGSEYPWNVGIYKLDDNVEEKYGYVCSGSLVSEYVVVTATQCVTDELGDLVPREKYLVAAGKHYRKFNDSRDMQTQISDITYINVHPGYKGTEKTVYNIALIVASKVFSFNNFVQPVCITELSDFWFRDGDAAMMTGWRGAETMESLEIENKSNGACPLPSSFEHLFFSLDNTCAEFKNGSSCLLPEDRGKGIVAKHPEDDRYYIHAVATYYESKECQKKFWIAKISSYSNVISCTTSRL
ncbi:uncharacterized protein LOC108909686 [Anoplophora glabripennis]|uniref:uncharacterized protein LOC108909686 n=1 Tax=Anoplophora glabripennis TaxID=217634 RepID=UPI0008748A44|nr:uncharacterized protein LOC108909686 [Anoplophora glabripennis]